MMEYQEWGAYVVEWVTKDPYGFLTTVTLVLAPMFIASAVISRKLAVMIDEYRKQTMQPNRRETIAN